MQKNLETGDKTNATVLIVDDISENLRLLSKILTDAGYIVRPANSGALALKSIQKTKPDLVLLDIKMPEMNGYEVCLKLKEDERTKDVPIIFISALGEPINKVRAFDVGGVDYITKPFQHEEVLARVKTHLTLRDMQRRLEQLVSEKTAALIGANKDLKKKIEDLKTAGMEIKESEEKYRRLVESLERDYFIYSHNTEGIVTYVSPSIENMLGYTQNDFLGHYTTYLTENPMSEDAKRLTELSIKGEKQPPYEIEIYHKDKSTRFLEVTEVPLFDEHGNVTTVEGIAHDITERRQAEEEKKKLETQLRQAQKMEAIGTLSGGIAHDFNNILSAVFGYTELAMNQAEHGSSQQNHLKEVIAAGKRAKDLVRQILTFSRQTEQEQIPVQIKHIVNEVLKLLRASLPTTIKIRQNIKSNPIVMSDPTQLHQILMNLCTNASHAMREKGGVLDVELDDVELDSNFTITHSDIKPGHYTRLTISDTGHGIPAKVLDRIFDPFFTTNEKGEGTGMGLSVVHGIVKSYEGAIDVYSEPGKGSTFKVFFPAVERRLEPETRIEKPIPRGTERILFVDDELSVADMSKKILEPLGYEVITRSSSIEALELFKNKPEAFDIVITDMTMPNMTGYELSKEIMAIRPDIPIILCTGFSERISEEKAKELGISAFAMKPLLSREMATTIRQVLDMGKEEKPVAGQRILVVDDEEQMRSMLRLMFENEGYEVSEAPDGKVALWLHKEKPSDLIITDLIMPEKEGIETILELKRDFPEVKIIAMTGGGIGGLKSYIALAKKSGADHAFAKPFEKEDLLNVVRNLLGDTKGTG